MWYKISSRCRLLITRFSFPFFFLFPLSYSCDFWTSFESLMSICNDCTLDVCLKSAQTETWTFYSKNFFFKFQIWKRKEEIFFAFLPSFFFFLHWYSKVMRYSTSHKYRLDSIHIFRFAFSFEYLIALRSSLWHTKMKTNETYFI